MRHGRKDTEFAYHFDSSTLHCCHSFNHFFYFVSGTFKCKCSVSDKADQSIPVLRQPWQICVYVFSSGDGGYNMCITPKFLIYMPVAFLFLFCNLPFCSQAVPSGSNNQFEAGNRGLHWFLLCSIPQDDSRGQCGVFCFTYQANVVSNCIICPRLCLC